MSTSSTSSTSSGGIGLPTLLGVLFIGLKLGHVISWPWLWVLAPLWMPFALLLTVALVAVVVLAVREVTK